MVDKPKLREFRQALFQNEEPLSSTDRRYVAHLHGCNEEDVINRLCEDILSSGSKLFYFTGQRGTGKSTELRRLEELLTAEDTRVIRFDSLDYIADTTPINLEMLLLLVTAGLADWTYQTYGENYRQAAAWSRFVDWLHSEVQISEVNVKGIKVALKEQQARVSTALSQVDTARRWADTIRGFAGEIIEYIRVASHRGRVVVIVDSLERLRGISSADQENMFTQVVATFAGDFDRLRLPGASVVYSVPPYLQLHVDIANYVDCYALASVRVFNNPKDGQARVARTSGLDLMAQLVGRRYPEWEQIISRTALDRLALNSGGDLRHFLLRLVSAVASQAAYALERLPLAPNDPIVERVLEESRVETERLTVRSEWALLRQVTTTHKAIAENRGDSLRTLAHLFETRVILNYRNGAEWFDVHPLLWPLIDAYPSAPGTSGISTP